MEHSPKGQKWSPLRHSNQQRGASNADWHFKGAQSDLKETSSLVYHISVLIKGGWKTQV